MISETSISKEAEERLSDVPEDKQFITRDNKELKNLHDLKAAAKDMSKETFEHHVNGEKNDFHNWVKDVHKDHELAENIKGVKSAEELYEHIEKRVNFLHNLRQKEVAFLKRHHINIWAFDFVFGLCLGVIVGLIIARFVF